MPLQMTFGSIYSPQDFAQALRYLVDDTFGQDGSIVAESSNGFVFHLDDAELDVIVSVRDWDDELVAIPATTAEREIIAAIRKSTLDRTSILSMLASPYRKADHNGDDGAVPLAFSRELAPLSS